MTDIILKAKEEHRILGGHPWIFSNELSHVKGDPAPGDVVKVFASDGRPLGRGFFNPRSLITVRLVPGCDSDEIGRDFLSHRILQSYELRKRLYPDLDAYRLVFGESDGLPGLVVDKYGDCLCVQCLCLGMDRLQPLIVKVLKDLFHPTAIVERNDSPLRTLEGLAQEKGILDGELKGLTAIEEGGLKFQLDLIAGQKTGFFFDLRETRLAIRRYARGASVLDCFCNEGALSIHCAAAGASRVIGIDSSEEAILRAKRNARANGFKKLCEFVIDDGFKRLKRLSKLGEKFDLVILDPPSFTRSKKSVTDAKRGYRDINYRAFRLLGDGGILVSSSCSHHITEETFLSTIDAAACDAGVRWSILERLYQAPDHPLLHAMPETRYLKTVIAAVRAE